MICILYTVQYTAYSVRLTLNGLECTICSVRRIFFHNHLLELYLNGEHSFLHSTLYIVQYTVYNSWLCHNIHYIYTLYTVHRTYSVYCMHIVHTVYTVRCITYSVRRIIFTVQYTLYSEHYALYSVQCELHMLYVVQRTMYCFISCHVNYSYSTVYSVQCTVYSVQYKGDIIKCIL